MDNSVAEYGRIKLKKVKKALEGNRFEAYIAENAEEAGKLVLNTIVPSLGKGIVSWGGSVTVNGCGVKNWFFESPDWEVLDTKAKGLDASGILEVRRQALLSDLYFLGTNALTEDGVLVNLDMIGNRVAALTFGPKKVVVIVGRNKICADVFSAMERVKEYASPANCIRLGMKTPCIKSASCLDCSTDDRICNTWTLTEKSFPPGRTAVVLVNEDLGL
ncbi:MAG: lactate utilization protein [Spirochaetes bacterium]|nr:MAG: lactate utilization protein [Spirochaetota bacterium]